MIIDTHCHYNLEPFFPDWQTHWHQAQAHGVTSAMVVGIDLESSVLAVEIAESDKNLQAAVGYHPHFFVENMQLDITEELAKLQTKFTVDQVAAIGETGLDYFRLPSDGNTEQYKLRQRESFRQQLQLAKKWQKPAIVHVRDMTLPETPLTDNAYWDAAELLTQELGGSQPFVLHCISGPLHYVKILLEQGAYIGIAGNVTYKNADAIRQLVKYAPVDCLLLETDAPFLPPQAHRGHACEPWMISETATFLEQELGIDREQLAANAKEVFNFS